MKNTKNIRKRLRVLVCVCMVLSVMCVSVSATDEIATINTQAISTAFTDGFSSMVVSCIGMISSMVPIALSLAGVLFMVKKAMGWFKGMAK